MKKSKVILSLLLILGALGGGAYYSIWNSLHHAPVISEPDGTAMTEPSENTPGKTTQANSRVNILLLGSDNRGNEAGRSDSIMLVTVNVDTHQVTVISVPRDTRVNLPGVGLTKITHANAVGEHKGGVHEGTLESVQAVSNLLGVPINYYVKIDFQGFVKAVDAVGGIDVSLPSAVNDEWQKIDLPAGQNHLTGDQALKLARARYSLANGDFDRQHVQFFLLSALAQKMLNPSNMTKLPGVINIVYKELMDTNMSAAQITAMGLDFKGITKDVIKYYQLPGKGISAEDPLVGAPVYYYEPDMDGVKEIVKQALAMN